MVGTKICGYCNGFFGRDDYEDKIIILEGRKWIVCAYLNGDDTVTCANFRTEEEKTKLVHEWSNRELPS